MFLALDTDILLFRAATAAEQEYDMGDDIWTLWTDLKEAKNLFETLVVDIAPTRNTVGA